MCPERSSVVMLPHESDVDFTTSLGEGIFGRRHLWEMASLGEGVLRRRRLKEKVSLGEGIFRRRYL